MDYETKKAGLVRNVPFVKNGPGSGFALIEQFFAEKYNPNGAEVQLLADALHVSEQEVKDWCELFLMRGEQRDRS